MSARNDGLDQLHLLRSRLIHRCLHGRYLALHCILVTVHARILEELGHRFLSNIKVADQQALLVGCIGGFGYRGVFTIIRAVDTGDVHFELLRVNISLIVVMFLNQILYVYSLAVLVCGAMLSAGLGQQLLLNA